MSRNLPTPMTEHRIKAANDARGTTNPLRPRRSRNSPGAPQLDVRAGLAAKPVIDYADAKSAVVAEIIARAGLAAGRP
jgi:hypothetical protein